MRKIPYWKDKGRNFRALGGNCWTLLLWSYALRLLFTRAREPLITVTKNFLRSMVTMEQDWSSISLCASILLGTTAILLLYWYSTRKHGYWKERNVPHPKTYPFLGSALRLFILPFHDVELERYMKFGAVYGHFEGNTPMLSVGDPKLLKYVMVKDFHAFPGRRDGKTNDEVTDKMLPMVQGEDWKRIRTTITPTFTTGKLKRMLHIFKDCSKTLVNNLQAYAEKGEPIDPIKMYGTFTMDVIASSAFSTKIDSHNDPNNKLVLTARETFSRSFNWRLIMFVFLPGLMNLLKIKFFFPKAVDFFSNFIHQVIEERKKSEQVRNDFLQLLLETEKNQEEGKLDLELKENDIAENYGKMDCDQIIKSVSTKKKLSFTELVAQCVIFLIAGYDTTSTTLSYVSYLLALNPDVQKKLRMEIDAVLEANNGEMTYEAIQDMKYLDNVIAETLRLFPGNVRLERQADEDYNLGDTGIKIPKGMIVTIPVYAFHRDPKYYPDPEKFDPDRFSPEERAKRDQYAYMPFGAGPRSCVAMRFALLEVKTCLAHVIRHFIIKKCPETKVPLEFLKVQVIMQPKLLKLQLEVRKDKA